MRLMILIVGLVLVVYVIGDAIFRRRKKQLSESQGSQHLHLGPVEDPLLEHTDTSFNSTATSVNEEDEFQEEEAVDSPVSTPSEKPQKEAGFLAFTIMPSRMPFKGATLLSVLEQHHFYIGKHDLFHFYQDDEFSEILFSIASVVQPGTFQQPIEQETYPGIVIYMMINDEEQSEFYFEKMITLAKQITNALKGKLCDLKRNPLTVQAIAKCREKIKENKALD